jgi:acetylornithine deacetylase/succinyl-diaminopimelate desuccinylase-like protein
VRPIDPTVSARAYADAERRLVDLIRLDTTNPPGVERPAAEYVESELRQAGLEPTVVGWEPARPNVVVRLRGRSDRGALLLLSHLDVVPADPAAWQHPPLAGHVDADGVIWGRGALDMKHIVAAMLTVAVLAHELELTLDRDLVFAATVDEETAGPSGAGWLFAEHPALVECALAISEGGDVLRYGDRTYLLIEAAQKGWLTLDLVRRSPPAHSAIPTRDNSLLAVGAILDRLAAGRFPHRVSAAARAMIEGLAADQPPPDRAALLDLLHADRCPTALASLTCSDATRLRLEAILHGHATPTLLHGGDNEWTVPAQARLTLAGRSLPGETLNDWLEALAAVIGPLGEFEPSRFDAGGESAVDTPFFRALADIAGREHPHARVLPNVMVGGGDLSHVRAAGGLAYGYFPLVLEDGASIWSLAHGRDERISRSNLQRCVRYAWNAVRAANDDALPAWPVPLDGRG